MTKKEKLILKENNKVIVERLLESVKKNGISLWKIKEDLELSDGYMYRVKTGSGGTKLSYKLLARILEKYPNINKGELLYGFFIDSDNKDFNEDDEDDEIASGHIALRDEIALKEKAKYDDLYWTNQQFKESIQVNSRLRSLTETEIIVEMAYESADAILKFRSKTLQ